MSMKAVILGDLKGVLGMGKAGAIEAEATVEEEPMGGNPYDTPARPGIKASGNGNGGSQGLHEPAHEIRGRDHAPQATLPQDPSIFTGLRFMMLVLVNVIALALLGFLAVAGNPGALQLIVFLPAVGMVALFCGLFAFIWITRKVSIPYFTAWRKGWFLRMVFSGNDVLFRPQEYGSGVIYSADGELKSYLKRGADLYRAGAVDVCPVVDECGLTADPVMVAGLGVMYARGLQTYAEVRKAYKEGVLTEGTEVEIPNPVIVPFRLLKNYIMGAPTSSLLYSHTDYQAERKYRLRAGLFGEKKGMVVSIIMLCVGIAIIIFALQMGGVKLF